MAEKLQKAQDKIAEHKNIVAHREGPAVEKITKDPHALLGKLRKKRLSTITKNGTPSPRRVNQLSPRKALSLHAAAPELSMIASTTPLETLAGPVNGKLCDQLSIPLIVRPGEELTSQAVEWQGSKTSNRDE